MLAAQTSGVDRKVEASGEKNIGKFRKICVLFLMRAVKFI